jgi:hypothetical protein
MKQLQHHYTKQLCNAVRQTVRHRQTDTVSQSVRQTDRQTDTQSVSQTDGQTDEHDERGGANGLDIIHIDVPHFYSVPVNSMIYCQ